jgi:hypothetical protein
MQTALGCSRFMGNSTGVKDQYGTLSLSIDKTVTGLSYLLAGGNNTFAYNSSSSVLVQGTVLYLDNGKNNFIHNPGNTACNFVLGEIAYTQATHESTSPYKFKASNNYWKEKPLNNNLSNGAMSMYFVKFPYPNSNSSTLNYFTGDLLSDLNKTCYNGSSCNPCAAVLSGEGNNKEHDKGQADSMQINIYPFPANDFIELEVPFEQAKVMTMKLVDLEGRVLFEGILSESKTRILTSEFANGIYILELGSSNRRIQKRILINHAW